MIQDGLYSIANATNRTATGWALGPGEDTDMTLTAYVLRAYVELEGRRGYPANRKILNRWLGWAVECQSEAGGWSDWQGIRDSPEASGYFLELVGLLGAMRMAWLEAYVTKAAALLIDTQSSNGGWKKDPSASSSTECVWVTQNAILGLRQFVEPTPLTAERSIADLRSAAVHTRFDFCVSFAGEDRAVAHALASKLEAIGASVFYDDFEQVELWGKDLVDYLAEIYSNRSTFCIPLFSKHYLRKAWPRHELRSAQVRALRTRREYILPVRIDDVTLPPAYRNVSCLSLEETPIEDVANLAFQKLRALTATSVSRSTRLARIANPATGGRIARRGKPGAEDRR